MYIISLQKKKKNKTIIIIRIREVIDKILFFWKL